MSKTRKDTPTRVLKAYRLRECGESWPQVAKAVDGITSDKKKAKSFEVAMRRSFKAHGLKVAKGKPGRPRKNPAKYLLLITCDRSLLVCRTDDWMTEAESVVEAGGASSDDYTVAHVWDFGSCKESQAAYEHLTSKLKRIGKVSNDEWWQDTEFQNPEDADAFQIWLDLMRAWEEQAVVYFVNPIDFGWRKRLSKRGIK